MQRPIRPLEWLVPNIFPRYCFLAAADAKAGKSRLYTTASLKVATSKPEVGTPPKMLYIAPDCTDRDQWTRDINEMLGGVPLDPGRLIVWFEGPDGKPLPKMGEGFVELLEAKLKQDPAIVGVVIDVYNSIKAEKRKGDDIQQGDHSSMRSLAELAERYNIGLALLTHTNVRGGIAGSMGLRGGVHALMKLEREEYGSGVDVHLRGRGINPDVRFHFDHSELCVDWEPVTVGDATENGPQDLDAERQLAADEREQEEARSRPHVPGAIEQRMLDTMSDASDWAPKALAESTGLRRSTVRSYLRRMLQRGQVVIVVGGTYRVATPATLATATANPETKPAGNEAESRPPVADVADVADVATHPHMDAATPAHPLKGSRECMGHCLRYVAPEKGEACDRCGHCRWRLLEDLYICQQCHPNWMDFISISIMEGGKS